MGQAGKAIGIAITLAILTMYRSSTKTAEQRALTALQQKASPVRRTSTSRVHPLKKHVNCVGRIQELGCEVQTPAGTRPNIDEAHCPALWQLAAHPRSDLVGFELEIIEAPTLAQARNPTAPLSQVVYTNQPHPPLCR